MVLHVFTTVPIVLLCAILNTVRNTEGPQVFFVGPAGTSSIVVFDKLYVQTNIITSVPCTALSRSSFCHRPIKPKHLLLYLSQLLLLRSSDAELNPGSRAVKFPCGVCSNTPASNLGYLAPPPGQFFMGAKLFIGTPWMGNEGVLKKILVWAM